MTGAAAVGLRPDGVDRPGVALLYQGAVAELLASDTGFVDAVSLIPETLWHERTVGPGAPTRYVDIEPGRRLFDAVAERFPIVFHGIGLSLGSAAPLDVEHVDQVGRYVRRYRPEWYSEHLAAFRVGTDGDGSVHAGTGLPVAFDEAVAADLVEKLGRAMERLDVPMLLENSAIYTEIPGCDMSEAEFLNDVSARAGSGVLLDLHNLVVNEINLGWDAAAYLRALDLDRVVEIHVAGGEWIGDFYTDAHSGRCPDRVHELLADVLPRCPSVRLVTFEAHESRIADMGEVGVRQEIGALRAAIERSRSVCDVA